MDTNSTYNPNFSNSTMTTPIKENQYSISSLLSPPESKRQDAFHTPSTFTMSRTPSSSSSYAPPQFQSTMSKDAVRPGLISPPISPQTKGKEQGRKDDGDGLRDPLLFPSSQDSSLTVATEPLFSQADTMDVNLKEVVIEEHLAVKTASGAKNVPTAEEYKLVIEGLSQIKFQSIVHIQMKKDPMAWWRQERAFENFYLSQGPQKNKKSSPQKITSPSYKKLAPAPAGIQKSRVTLPRVRNNPKPKRAAPLQQLQQLDDYVFPQYSPPLPKAPRPATTRDDADYSKLSDHSPPVFDTLGNNSKALKADWKGQMLDLSNDPDRHELHPAELNLASTLRLTCAMYITSKRRIFIARIEALQKNKEFRKTDAQQACKIDVNKASKLWTAFDKVGWFDARYFR
jgi:hypothetical protein